ncbi:MAG: hypothetical protein ABH967_00030 [Patescibacteria group bacterium]
MSKNKKYIITIVFLLSVLFLESLAWPSYFLKQTRNIEEKIESFSVNLADRQFSLGWDFVGGEKLTYKVSKEEDNIPEVLLGLQSILDQRMKMYGRDAYIKIENGKLIVEMNEDEDVGMIKEIVKMVPTLDFREKDESDNFIATDLTGESLNNVFLGIDQNNRSKPLMIFQFNEAGEKMLENITSRNIGKQIGLYVDGVPLFPLNVQDTISGGNVQIQLNLSLEIAKELTQIVKASSVSPSLDLLSEQSLAKSQAQLNNYNFIKVSSFMILAIFWILIINYNIQGLIGFVLLILNCLLVLLFAKLSEASITYASVLGFSLSFLISLLNQILILRAIKKELKIGKSFGIASEEGLFNGKKKMKKINIMLLALFCIFFFFISGAIKDFSSFFLLGMFFTVAIWLTVFETLILSLDRRVFKR